MEYIVRSLGARASARGGAALSRESLVDLALETDDCVSITADGETYAFARVREGSNEDGGLPTVGLDSYLCGHLGAEPGDRVSIEPAAVTAARSVELRIPDVLFFQGEVDRIRDVLRSRLERRPLVEDRPAMLALPLDESGTEQHFPVRPTDLDPVGPVVVTDETTIEFEQDAYVWTPRGEPTAGPTRFEDVGGLDDELERIRELVELPVAHPELFEHLDLDPPSGVLLHGPPGTGKTLIARTIATELEATFVHLDGPEIQRPLKGMSEAALRDAFDRAREAAPSVVFIDEIDALAPDRDGDRVDQGDSRLVAQLLTLLDGLEETEDVIVVGATNRLEAIDPALRRPGRFDREVEIGVPGEAARREILEIHARNVPLSPAVDLADYAARTHGFVGADLESLVVEAGMNALARVRPDIDSAGDRIDERTLEGIVVTVADFDQALTTVEPSAMREAIVEVPTVSWEDVGGLESVRRRLQEAVQWPLEYGAAFRTLEVDPPSGVLLHGPPGTGKTLLTKAAANEAESNVLVVKAAELLSKWVGESEGNVREVFETARTNAPCLVCIDEIDAIGTERDGWAGDGGVSDRVVSQLLAELDGLDAAENVVVVATTNRPELLDGALLRPGRLDYRLEVPLPDEAARREILAVHARDRPLADGVDLEALAARTDGFSGAELEAVCREAALAALRDVVERVPPEAVEETVESVSIHRTHVERALEVVREDDGDVGSTA